MALLGTLASLPAAAAVAPDQAPIPPSEQPSPADKKAILDMVKARQDAWNRGDFRGYMSGFENPGIIFVSNGKIQPSWQATLDHYIKGYPTKEARGHVRFYDATIRMLGPNAALLICHLHMTRPKHPLEGVFTDIVQRIDGKWIITMNHVSAYDAAKK
ncbi:MAG: nuclear transport factor 2 family protein [Alphaproteobacteria bacterium]|nr:nuclear transport factor 2 family protein [Alphaproteobacteria bacterium]